MTMHSPNQICAKKKKKKKKITQGQCVSHKDNYSSKD